MVYIIKIPQYVLSVMRNADVPSQMGIRLGRLTMKVLPLYVSEWQNLCFREWCVCLLNNSWAILLDLRSLTPVTY